MPAGQVPDPPIRRCERDDCDQPIGDGDYTFGHRLCIWCRPRRRR